MPLLGDPRQHLKHHLGPMTRKGLAFLAIHDLDLDLPDDASRTANRTQVPC
ncbi:hypothetical protein ABZX40_34755 [Streptomyces sp. NPDC004610]|uniref:hypothetical protein n=1 Tax=unclassified Streptomyces TaxID=2593676 RepID=UPI0033ABDEC2